MNSLLLLFIFLSFASSESPKISFCEPPLKHNKFDQPNYVYSKLKNDPGFMRIDLCGQVLAPATFVLKKLKSFDQYAKINSFVKSVKTPSADQIYVEVGFLGFEFNSKLSWEQKHNTMLIFKVNEGPFRGMILNLWVIDLQRRRSMVAMKAIYKYTEVTLPDFILESGARALAKQLARNMKSWLSLEYLKQREQQNGGTP